MLILKIIFTFIFYFPIICQARKYHEVTTKENLTSEEEHKNLMVLEKWENLEKNVKNLVNEGIKMAMPLVMENFGKLNMSKECIMSSLHLISGLKELKPWAFEFFDSSGKFFDGTLTVSASSFGQYDQCMDIQVKSTKPRDKGKLLYGGQYCLIDIKPPLPPRASDKIDKIPLDFKNFSQRDTIFAKAVQFMDVMYYASMRLGICIPSKCSEDDLRKIVHLLGSKVYLNTSVYRCEVKKENEFTPVPIFVITCYSLIGGLVLVATLMDAFVPNTNNVFKSKAMQVLLSFSFFTNFKKFSSTNASQSNSIRCLNGIRFIGTLWVIIYHTYLEILEINLHGVVYLLDRRKDFEFQAILNAVVVVDTFFLMGALLVSKNNMKRYKGQKHKFNIVMFIIHRILRILPAYVVIIMFSSLIHMLGSGPVWQPKANHYQPCYKYWWTNLLFINNFYNENLCFSTTWYVASDFQLYVFSRVIIIPLLRWPKLGICVGVLTIIACICYTGIETYIKDYPATAVFYGHDVHAILNYLTNFSFRPFIHTGPYAAGILAGYLLAIKPKLKITPFFQILGWSLAFTFCFTAVFGTTEWYKDMKAPLVPSIIYASFRRTTWSLGVAWMIICCATGYGGIINYILSMNVFAPLGSLSFLAYLIHPIVQMLTHGSTRVRVQPSHYSMVYLTLGHICVSYAVAFIVHMFVEVPFANLVQIFLPRAGKKEERCNKGKDNDFHEAHINADKKEEIIDVTFVLNGKSNDLAEQINNSGKEKNPSNLPL